MHKNYHFKSRNGKVNIHTSNKELKDLFTAWVFVSFAFAIARTVEKGIKFDTFFSINFLIFMAISAATVGIAFLAHELSHKIIAQRYRCWAEFRADFTMLAVGVLTSFLGVVFIAPGAVMIFGNIDYKQNGKISMAGPMINIILAIILLPLLFIKFNSALLTDIITSGYLINAWLALFNMIPFGNFDGAKIYTWNRKIFYTMIILSAFLIFFYFVDK
ncbi:MAG: metalloprotease [Candidatus Woesearchaeota archaeon]